MGDLITWYFSSIPLLWSVIISYWFFSFPILLFVMGFVFKLIFAVLGKDK